MYRDPPIVKLLLANRMLLSLLMILNGHLLFFCHARNSTGKLCPHFLCRHCFISLSLSRAIGHHHQGVWISQGDLSCLNYHTLSAVRDGHLCFVHFFLLIEKQIAFGPNGSVWEKYQFRSTLKSYLCFYFCPINISAIRKKFSITAIYYI